MDEALDHAIDIMSARGVGGLSVSEVARRMGMAPPSLYKYFPSLNALYDALFAAGIASHSAALSAATKGADDGVAHVRAVAVATVRWAIENPALAQLLFWRPVPDFEPSPTAFAASQESMAQLREQFAVAARNGELSADADSDDAVRLLTVCLSGLISQQLANQPRATFRRGSFTRLTEPAVDMFLDYYRSDRRQ
jgi:AcrR family transcriptional regulator